MPQRSQPLVKRKTLLQGVLKDSRRICYCQHVGEVGERLFQKAEELGLEGITAKKADSPLSQSEERAKSNE